MIKTISTLGIACLILFSVSCRKAESILENETIVYNKTVDVTINQNESYSYLLPEQKHQTEFEIISQAKHFSTSTVTENVYGEKTYLYKPLQNYYGTDQVVLQSNEKHDGGGCSQHNNDANTQTVYTIRITVNKTASVINNGSKTAYK